MRVGTIFSSSLRVVRFENLYIWNMLTLLKPDALERILSTEPSKARFHFWCSRTSRPFDLFDDIHLNQTKTIRCPRCRFQIEVAYMNTEKTGYFQQNFSVRCPSSDCAKVPKVTKAVLGARKLAEDLVREDAGPWTYLAGTIRTHQDAADLKRGKAIKKVVLAHPKFAPRVGRLLEECIVSTLEKNRYSLEGMRSAMASTTSPNSGRLIRRIFSAYTDGEIFSLDLVGAVIRQGSFIKKMRELSWTDPRFFESRIDEAVLYHAIARYHAFLDLLACEPQSVFVPTLDIDLVWHTHQLNGTVYNSDCKKYVGRYIDHDDKIEEAALSDAFNATSSAWKKRFKVPYTHCGCPIPGQSIGKKLTFLRATQLHSNKVPPYLVPLDHPAALSGSHPSDHNAVFLFHRRNAGLAAQQKRIEESKKLQAHDGKGKQVTDITAHHLAFLVPVPMYFTYPEDVLCAVNPGNVINNQTGNVSSGQCVSSVSVPARRCLKVNLYLLRLVKGTCAVGKPACGAGGICGVGGGWSQSSGWGSGKSVVDVGI
ncbi:hypothetical protein H0H81_009052 [Sphagnurus paluster]|uniref:Uncharacterized protein n=1 Tax=Sphagnurus paluster TaxID=117069 RepID=A0A9P7K4Q0_9AGAR|nr:hypothetical protein H0H81_009052 [Sphagnurus paluster]